MMKLDKEQLELLIKQGEKKKVTENQQKILKYVSENQHISARELTEKIGISERKIKENIAKLKKKGMLKRIGPDRGGYWKVKK